jgi:hypothetical protein
VNECLPPTMTPFGNIPDRCGGICQDGLEVGPFSIAKGNSQGETVLVVDITSCASQSSSSSAAFLIPPRVFPIGIWASLVEEKVCCEAERPVELVCNAPEGVYGST